MGMLKTKVLVLGGGPGGYVAAIRCGQHGIDTVLVEADRLGGTCLNIGCIPSKALIHAADAYRSAREQSARATAFGVRVEKASIDFAQTKSWNKSIVGRLTGGVASLLRRAKVKVVHGQGTMIDGKTCQVQSGSETVMIVAEHVVLATGSQPVELGTLSLGGAVIDSSKAFELPEIPARMAVVGAGYIGLELGTAFAKLGSHVTIVEAADRILPQYDRQLTSPILKRLRELEVSVMLSSKAMGMDQSNSALSVETPEGRRIVAADTVLVAVGRKPNTAGWGLEGLDLTMNGRFIAIDDRCATSMHNVWAIGDVTGDPMLAHRAMAQGETVADIIVGRRRRFDKIAMPSICFTDPEIVCVGLSPDEAASARREIGTAVFPLTANGRAMTLEAEEGFVRVVFDASDHLILGIQAVGKGVSELAGELSLALEMGATLEDVAATVHAHPTMGEAVQEAAMKGLGRGLHL